MRAALFVKPAAVPPAVDLMPLDFAALNGFDAEDHVAAFAAFARTAEEICNERPNLRPARPPSAAFAALCREALAEPPGDSAGARRFFMRNFRPFRVASDHRASAGFVSGYFEPVVAGALTPSAEFSSAILARPADLVTLTEDERVLGVEPSLRAARRLPDGSYSPYPERAAIEAGAIAAHTRPIAWLRDPFEAFLIHVQGSARVALPEGPAVRLVYAGRNGQPYSSIGRMLVEMGEIPASDMGLARLKQWIYAHGLAPGQAGAALLARNKSYIFFALDFDAAETEGPIGGAGVRLTPLRSIAVDRSLWPYGLPFWVSAELPWQGPEASPFRRLMIAQDTGSAILGSARADIFFGSGEEAGRRAGEIRHACDFIVLLPRCDGEGL
jgi:membrane-bound lytic murein transglycosylase A